MLPEWLSGCGGSCASSWPGGLRGSWLDGWNSSGVPACRACSAPTGCGSGCGVPVGWDRSYGMPLGFDRRYGAGWNCGNSGCSCGYGASNCACGYRWCDCPECNPLGGYGDGPCGGYISYWDRYYSGC